MDILIIVDTSVWVDFFAGRENLQSLWLRGEMGTDTLGLTDLILCEVLQGLRDERAFTAIARQLTSFPIFNTGGRDLAVASASNYRSLRARGLTVRKTIDCIIATHCIRNGHALLHHDRDFEPFEQYLSLQVIHPQTQ